MEAIGNEFMIGGFADAFVEGADGLVSMHGIKLDLSGLVGVDFSVGGHFIVECIDEHGSLCWETTAENGVTDAGIVSLLNTRYRGAAQITAWYIGLIDNAGFSKLDPSDTAASHAGWSEVNGTYYSDSTRIQWSPGAPSGGAIVNATSADFHMVPPAPISVYGLFLISDSTKGGTAGLIEATAPFSSGQQSTKSGDTLRVTYTMSAASN